MYSDSPIEPFYTFPHLASRDAGIPEVERLAKLFAGHEAHERDSLKEYREAAARNRDPLLGFLLNLVIADEDKHHLLIRQIAEALDANLAWRTPASPLPTLGRITAGERDRLLRLTSEFIEEEKRGLREYRTLIKSSDRYYNGLLTLVLRTIIHDSEKHLMILRFIAQQLRDARPERDARAESDRVTA